LTCLVISDLIHIDYVAGLSSVAVYIAIAHMLQHMLDTSPSLKLGPSEPRLEVEEEDETDSPTHSLIQPKEEGFLPEDGVIEVSHSTKQPAL